ncbi:MAG: serine/threonine-protein kinase [Myxococcota bacterium]
MRLDSIRQEGGLSSRFPQAFGRFWLQEKIGHGGMAEVFRATLGPDPETYAFEMALKRMHRHLEHDPAQVDMFMTEADVAKFLKHDNIVRVYDAGLIEHHAYIAMEYIWGLDLSRLLLRLRERKIRIPPGLAVFIALSVLRALDYVHRAHAPGGEPMHMVHRDVTPSNIYLTYDGQVKLADFGVARVSFLERHEDTRTLKGKVAYMPPEVLAGDPVDERVDLWSVAVCLYETLTMRRLHGALDESELLAGAVNPKIAPVHTVDETIDVELSRILKRALHRSPRRRPRQAVDFYRLLKRYHARTAPQVDQVALGRFMRESVGIEGPVGQTSFRSQVGAGLPDAEYHAPIEMSPTDRFELRQRSRRWWVPAIALAVTLGVAGLVWWLGS